MGEMVRRLEYERRARSLMKTASRDKLIAKEYTQPVRAANTSVSKSLETAVKKVDLEQRSFREKFSKNLGNVHAFKKTVSSKSLNFTDDEFNPESRLSLPPLTTRSNDSGMYGRSELRKLQRERRRSSLTITDLVERSKQTNEEKDRSSPTGVEEPTFDSARRNSSTFGRRLSIGSQNDGRSFRVLKDKFLPNKEGEPDSRTQRILDCKAAEHRRSSILSERIQQLYLEVEQT